MSDRSNWRAHKRENIITGRWQWDVWNQTYNNRQVYADIPNTGEVGSSAEADAAIHQYLNEVEWRQYVGHSWEGWQDVEL